MVNLLMTFLTDTFHAVGRTKDVLIHAFHSLVPIRDAVKVVNLNLNLMPLGNRSFPSAMLASVMVSLDNSSPLS
jgi:hypothetical protein